MCTALGLEISVRVRTFDRERGTADARFIARRRLDDVRLESAALCPAHVHANEHLRPVGGVRSTDARGDGQHGVPFVVRTAELCLEAGLVDLAGQLRELALEIRAERRVLRHRCQLGEIRGALAEGLPSLDARADKAETLHHLLRALAIVPKVGCGGLGL
jgi:hypothetical protein